MLIEQNIIKLDIKQCDSKTLLEHLMGVVTLNKELV